MHLRLILSLVFLSASLFSNGQSDYQPFRVGKQYLYYNHSIDSASYTPYAKHLGIRLHDTCQSMYTSLRGIPNTSEAVAAPPFTGQTVCVKEDSTQLYLRDSLVFTIRHAAPVGTVWHAFTGSTWEYIYGKVDSVRWESFLGIQDSVKYFSFGGLHSDDSTQVYPIHVSPVRISRQYGMVQSIVFRDFVPLDPLPFGEGLRLNFDRLELIGLSEPTVGVQLPDSTAILSLSLGEEVHTSEARYHLLSGGGFNIRHWDRTHLITAVVDDTIANQRTYYWTGEELYYYHNRSSNVYQDSMLLNSVEGEWQLDLDFIGLLTQQPGTLVEFSGTFNAVSYIDVLPDVICQRSGLFFSEQFSTTGGTNYPDAFSYLFDSVPTRFYLGGLGGSYVDQFYPFQGLIRFLPVYYATATDTCGTPHQLSSVVIGTSDTRGAFPLQVFPNPTTDVLSWSSSAGVTIERIVVCDRLGRELIQHAVTGTTSLSLADLPSGMYYLRFCGAGGEQTVRRVVKQ